MTVARDLYDVRRQAERIEDARFKLREAARRAHSNGASLRTIARESGIYSHEQIRKLIAGK